MNNNLYTILVNTSDSFEDCWNPFFTLLKKKWEISDTPILLNTEFKLFSFDELNIESAQSHKFTTTRKLTWSECLINALNKIETPLVLYMQEDYFIDSEVQSNVIQEFASLMIKDPSVKHIGLTNSGSYPPFSRYAQDDRLWTIGQKSEYRISTQAGLWDIETLLSYLKPEEGGWMFEIFGSKRAQKRNEIFLTANYDFFKPPIIHYPFTGIIKGKWNAEIVPLFDENKIVIDFSKRGFYRKKPLLVRKLETLNKLVRNPIHFFKGISGK